MTNLTIKHLNFDRSGRRIVDAAALSASLVNISFCILYLTGIEGRMFDFLFFVLISGLVPLTSAVVLRAVGSGAGSLQRRSILVSFRVHAVASAVVLLLSAAPLLAGAEGGRWVDAGAAALMVVCSGHALWGLWFLLGGNDRRRLPVVLRLPFRLLVSDVGLAVAAGIGLLLLFPTHIGPWIFEFGGQDFAALSPQPGRLMTGMGSLYAASLLVAALGLVAFEAKLGKQDPERLKRLSLPIAALLVPGIAVFFLDLKLNTDVLHFMASVGPAWRIAAGDGTPRVDAVSQYGAGPMMMTWAGLEAFGNRFGAANLVAQAHSIVLYAVLLACLYRMTHYRLAAMLLGFATIGLLLAGWWHGNASLNTVPSSMGMRYLPLAIVVLAISILPRHRSMSVPLFASMTLATVWSFEACIGATAIYGLFLTLKSIRDRSILRFLGGLVIGAFLPIVFGLAIVSGWTLIDAGQLPDMAAYLAFTRLYNPASEFWALAAPGDFLGWIPVVAITSTALTLSFVAAISTREPASGMTGDAKAPVRSDENLLIYQVTPMAGLALVMSAYFVSRSVPFTLIIALPPLAMLVIPVLLGAVGRALAGDTASTLSLLAPGAVLLSALSFSFVAVQREDGPYQSLFGLCIHEGVCSQFALAALVGGRIDARPMLDQSANPNYFDATGLAGDAIDLIERYEPARPEIALFLGIHPTTIWSVHTDTVLFLTGKVHRWPISFVLTDELNSVRLDRILAADVRLDEGETVFVRADKTRLGHLEGSLLTRIRASLLLCPVDTSGQNVHAYRATYADACPVPDGDT